MRFGVVSSINTVNFGFPYQGTQHGRLTVRNHPRHGHEVMFRVDKGQIPCSVTGCTVLVRFDESKPVRWQASGAVDHDPTVVFLDNTTQFRRRLATARRLRMELTFYTEGAHTFEFDVAGFRPDLKSSEAH